MFPSSVIRRLARSEEMFAETQNFLGLAAHVEGPLDIDAMSDAFDLLLQAHPVLAGHLEKDPDGRWEIVLDDLLHPGIEVIELDGPDAEPPVPRVKVTDLSASGLPKTVRTPARVAGCPMVAVVAPV